MAADHVPSPGCLGPGIGPENSSSRTHPLEEADYLCQVSVIAPCDIRCERCNSCLPIARNCTTLLVEAAMRETLAPRLSAGNRADHAAVNRAVIRTGVPIGIGALDAHAVCVNV